MTMSSMLGWVAAVIAMVSPSQPRPAVIQRTSNSAIGIWVPLRIATSAIHTLPGANEMAPLDLPGKGASAAPSDNPCPEVRISRIVPRSIVDLTKVGCGAGFERIGVNR